MFIAISSLPSGFAGSNYDKMVDYVNNQNNKSTYNKYFLVEVDDFGFKNYKKSNNIFNCNPSIVYDPFDVGSKFFNTYNKYGDMFVRTFGSRSSDR